MQRRQPGASSERTTNIDFFRLFTHIFDQHMYLIQRITYISLIALECVLPRSRCCICVRVLPYIHTNLYTAYYSILIRTFSLFIFRSHFCIYLFFISFYSL